MKIPPPITINGVLYFHRSVMLDRAKHIIERYTFDSDYVDSKNPPVTIGYYENGTQWMIGDIASCPSAHIQHGFNATIGKFRVSQDGQVWARLDFKIISKIPKWVKIEELES